MASKYFRLQNNAKTGTPADDTGVIALAMYACSIEAGGSETGRACISADTRDAMRELNRQRAEGEITLEEYMQMAHRSVATPLVYAEGTSHAMIVAWLTPLHPETDEKTVPGAARAQQRQSIRSSLLEEFGLVQYQASRPCTN